jgi:multiple sugar transport system ATP-binding protein
MVGELTLPGNGFRLPVPDHLRDRLSGMVGKHLVMGIRPEHFGLRQDEVPSARETMEVTINVVEPLGSDMDVYMSTPLNDHVVGRVPARQGLELGKKTAVVVDVDRAHFFEPGATGMNLSLAQEPAHAAA